MNKVQKTLGKWLGLGFLIDATNWQNRYQRPYEPQTANSFSSDVSLSDWTMLVSDSRKLYWNLGPVTAVVDDKAMYAIGRAWDVKFSGSAENKAWGDKAAAWLNKIWYPTANVRGQGFDFKSSLNLMSLATDTDGEIYVFLTEGASGWPQFQLIPATMIGQRDVPGVVEDGPYKGLTIVQGVIYNANTCAVAYRVLGETEADDKDYSALDLIQVFDPKTPDQVRGLPVFTHALLDLKDLRTIQGNEKMVSAICSTIGIIEHNEIGAADPNDPSSFLRRSQIMQTENSTQGPNMTVQNYQGVTARYFRSGAGSKLEQLKLDRPGDAWDRFMNRLIRNACVGAGWPYEMAWDASLLGGANVRLLLAKAMRTVEDRQDLLRPVARRIIGYAVAKAIKAGILEPNDEWYDWDFAMPARISVDYGRDAKADLSDYQAGITNLQDILEEQGKDLVAHVAQRAYEKKLIEDAGLTVYGIDQPPTVPAPGTGKSTQAGIDPPQ